MKKKKFPPSHSDVENTTTMLLSSAQHQAGGREKLWGFIPGDSKFTPLINTTSQLMNGVCVCVTWGGLFCLGGRASLLIQRLRKHCLWFVRSVLPWVTLWALTLFDPGGEGLLEVFVLLECDGGAHLGGQHHFGTGGALAWNGADDDLWWGSGRWSSSNWCGCDGAWFLFETFLRWNRTSHRTRQTSKEQLTLWLLYKHE